MLGDIFFIYDRLRLREEKMSLEPFGCRFQPPGSDIFINFEPKNPLIDISERHRIVDLLILRL